MKLAQIAILLSIFSLVINDPAFVIFESQKQVIANSINELSTVFEQTCKEANLFPDISFHKGFFIQEILEVFNFTVTKDFYEADCVEGNISPSTKSIILTSKDECHKIIFGFNYKYHYRKDYFGTGSFYVRYHI